MEGNANACTAALDEKARHIIRITRGGTDGDRRHTDEADR
jgi:hypothetical protein